MRGEIVFAEIGLDLDNFADVRDACGLVNQPFSQQFLGDADGVAVIKCARKFFHGGRLAQFPV